MKEQVRKASYTNKKKLFRIELEIFYNVSFRPPRNENEIIRFMNEFIPQKLQGLGLHWGLVLPLYSIILVYSEAMFSVKCFVRHCTIRGIRHDSREQAGPEFPATTTRPKWKMLLWSVLLQQRRSVQSIVFLLSFNFIFNYDQWIFKKRWYTIDETTSYRRAPEVILDTRRTFLQRVCTQIRVTNLLALLGIAPATFYLTTYVEVHLLMKHETNSRVLTVAKHVKGQLVPYATQVSNPISCNRALARTFYSCLTLNEHPSKLDILQLHQLIILRLEQERRKFNGGTWYRPINLQTWHDASRVT